MGEIGTTRPLPQAVLAPENGVHWVLIEDLMERAEAFPRIVKSGPPDVRLDVSLNGEVTTRTITEMKGLLHLQDLT